MCVIMYVIIHTPTNTHTHYNTHTYTHTHTTYDTHTCSVSAVDGLLRERESGVHGGMRIFPSSVIV
jgi:hypothetical protein